MILNHLNSFEVSSSIDMLNSLSGEAQEKYLYYDYLKSPTWKLRTEIYMNHYDNKCQKCGQIKKKGLTLHHLHYNTLTIESCGDLLLVCKKCHYKIHQSQQ